MGKINSKDKGKRGERMCAAKMREYGYEARRGIQYQGSPESPDVVGVPGLHIEVKFTEKLRLWDAIEQSIRDAGADEIPVVMHKKNNSEWLAILRLDDFMPIYAEWEAGQESEEQNK